MTGFYHTILNCPTLTYSVPILVSRRSRYASTQPGWVKTLSEAQQAVLEPASNSRPELNLAGSLTQPFADTRLTYPTGAQPKLRVRLHNNIDIYIIRNERIENVVKSQSCMVSKVRMIWKRTRSFPR